MRARVLPQASGAAAILRALRAHLARHNRHVLVLATGTLLGSALLWVLLYGIASWLTVLFVTAARGFEATRPAGFNTVFFSVGAALLGLAWFDRWLTPNDLPRDHKTATEIAFDFLLAIPRTTLAIYGTLSAWQQLTDAELVQTTSFLERLGSEGRIAMQAIPLELPHKDSRLKILFALQLVQIIEVRREDQAIWVSLSPLRPSSLELGNATPA